MSYRADGQQTITQRYYPWGTIRPGPDNALPTDYTFTRQKLDESTGLMYYGVRYYDAALGRFVQADTIVPNPANPQDLNRYAYVRNNPLKYTDPSGHKGWDAGAGGGCSINDLACLARGGASTYKKAYGIYGYPTDEELEAACAAGYNPFLDPDYWGASIPGGEPYFDFYYRWAYDTGGWLPLPDELRSDVFAYWTFVQTGEVPGATGWRDISATLVTDPQFWSMTATAAFGMLQKHHTVPVEVLKGHLPRDVANNPRVRGKRGAPNRWLIPEDVHIDIHRGPGGGQYNERWMQELAVFEQAPDVEDVLRIRDALVVEFGIDKYRPR